MPANPISAMPTRWAKAGCALFGTGLVLLAITVIPFFFGDHNRSLWLNIGCMLAPLGLGIAVVSVLRSGRAEQAEVLTELYPEGQ